MSNLNKGRFPMADFGEFVQNRKIPKSNSVVFGQMEKIPAKNCIEFASGNLLRCDVFVRETGRQSYSLHYRDSTVAVSAS